MLIGLTGGIASGKSKVSSFLSSRGAFIIDADRIAREIVKPYKNAWKKIVDTWGEEILSPDLSLDRTRLGSIVFSDKEALERLNAITHPEIIREIEHELGERSSEDLIVLDAPLLIEAGLCDVVDEVWLVSVTAENQLERLCKRDGISSEEAKKRINSQMPLKEKEKYAHLIIDNNGTWEETGAFMEDILKKIAAKGGKNKKSF